MRSLIFVQAGTVSLSTAISQCANSPQDRSRHPEAIRQAALPQPETQARGYRPPGLDPHPGPPSVRCGWCSRPPPLPAGPSFPSLHCKPATGAICEYFIHLWYAVG
jgi:hypothetical protein